MLKHKIALLSLMPLYATPLAAGNFGSTSLEVGFERFQPVAPAANANFTGAVLNLYFTPHVYLGTNQTALYLRGDSDYRPDVHLGVLMPLLDFLAIEAAIGVDFYTGLIIALAILDEDDSIDYKFATNFYAPYFNLTAGLRFEFDMFALRLMTQTQFGGYLQSDHSAFNASLWLGAGVMVRFAL